MLGVSSLPYRRKTLRHRRQTSTARHATSLPRICEDDTDHSTQCSRGLWRTPTFFYGWKSRFLNPCESVLIRGHEVASLSSEPLQRSCLSLGRFFFAILRRRGFPAAGRKPLGHSRQTSTVRQATSLPRICADDTDTAKAVSRECFKRRDFKRRERLLIRVNLC